MTFLVHEMHLKAKSFSPSFNHGNDGVITRPFLLLFIRRVKHSIIRPPQHSITRQAYHYSLEQFNTSSLDKPCTPSLRQREQSSRSKRYAKGEITKPSSVYVIVSQSDMLTNGFSVKRRQTPLSKRLVDKLCGPTETSSKLVGRIPLAEILRSVILNQSS